MPFRQDQQDGHDSQDEKIEVEGDTGELTPTELEGFLAVLNPTKFNYVTTDKKKPMHAESKLLEAWKAKHLDDEPGHEIWVASRWSRRN